MSDKTDKQTRLEKGRKEIQLACFRIGTELYGLDIMRIREIIRPQKLTAVPRAPTFIEGVINLRGVVIPVVDMRRRFGQEIPPENRHNRVIICNVIGKILGLMVDEVVEVRRYTRDDVQSAPQFLKGPGAEFFLGVCRRDDELIMVLDLEKILSTQEQIDLEKVS